MRRADRVIAPRHHHHTAIFHGDGFVQAAIVGIDALKGESLRRIEAVVIGFLQAGFAAFNGAVVLVRGITRPVAGRGDHFHHEELFGRHIAKQDVAHLAPVSALAAHLRRALVRGDQAGRKAPFGGGLAQGDFQLGQGFDREVVAGRHIHGKRRLRIERAVSRAEIAPLLLRCRNMGQAGDDHDAHFGVVAALFQARARFEPEHFKAHVLPVGRLRIDVEDAARGFCPGPDVQTRHAEILSLLVGKLSARGVRSDGRIAGIVRRHTPAAAPARRRARR